MTVTNIIATNNYPKKRTLVVGLMLLITLVVGFWIYSTVFKSAPLSGLASPANLLSSLKPTGAYWAVLLNNGQWYFGKLDPDDLNNNFITLSDVHFLEKSEEPVAPLKGATPQPSASGYNIIKLGNEIHGPMDTMLISRTSITFLEQLRSDSKVVTAITAAK